MTRFISLILLVALHRAWSLHSITPAADAERVNVEIVFTDKHATYSFNLDRFKPEGDSCVELFINFYKTPAAGARFLYATDRKWRFENIHYNNTSERRGSIKVKTIGDQGGNFEGARIFIGTDADSLPAIDRNINRKWDVPVLENPLPPFNFSFERKATLCAPRDQTKEIVRKFTYPSWYMRREPVLNYPELSMFHCGNSVRLPTPGSIEERGMLMIYWHILHPKEVEYDAKVQK